MAMSASLLRALICIALVQKTILQAWLALLSACNLGELKILNRGQELFPIFFVS